MKAEKRPFLVTITSTAVDHRQGSFDGPDGKVDYDFHVQTAYLDVGEQFPHPFEIRLPKTFGGKGHPQGEYTIANPLQIVKGKLVVPRELTLVPVGV